VDLHHLGDLNAGGECKRRSRKRKQG
jgi:hypothetical protein